MTDQKNGKLHNKLSKRQEFPLNAFQPFDMPKDGADVGPRMSLLLAKQCASVFPGYLL
jgi:hypothetical protein